MPDVTSCLELIGFAESPEAHRRNLRWRLGFAAWLAARNKRQSSVVIPWHAALACVASTSHEDAFVTPKWARRAMLHGVQQWRNDDVSLYLRTRQCVIRDENNCREEVRRKHNEAECQKWLTLKRHEQAELKRFQEEEKTLAGTQESLDIEKTCIDDETKKLQADKRQLDLRLQSISQSEADIASQQRGVAAELKELEEWEKHRRENYRLITDGVRDLLTATVLKPLTSRWQLEARSNRLRCSLADLKSQREEVDGEVVSWRCKHLALQGRLTAYQHKINELKRNRERLANDRIFLKQRIQSEESRRKREDEEWHKVLSSNLAEEHRRSEQDHSDERARLEEERKWLNQKLEILNKKYVLETWGRVERRRLEEEKRNLDEASGRVRVAHVRANQDEARQVQESRNQRSSILRWISAGTGEQLLPAMLEFYRSWDGST
eukprot:TRINITY_DN55680_c0_g1_i1.p1 TRINITY_DN55680_c0_g1~~TRINITY_DN55680_c0_g1_i1.p1  ORF type:complete len:511 (-),score=67.67 TRINITY_DN55680_c0_g1_i1:2-1312(-)